MTFSLFLTDLLFLWHDSVSLQVEEGMPMERDNIRETILEAMEDSLAAQLRAVRRLRGGGAEEPAPRQGRSQMDIVQDILRKARQPLHVSLIISRAAAQGAALERESLVSALSKKVARGQRFVRTAPNTFALKGEER